MADKEPPVKRVTLTRNYRLTQHTCSECGVTFEGVLEKEYCSDVCRRRAAWRRNGGKVNERRKQERRQQRKG